MRARTNTSIRIAGLRGTIALTVLASLMGMSATAALAGEPAPTTYSVGTGTDLASGPFVSSGAPIAARAGTANWLDKDGRRVYMRSAAIKKAQDHGVSQSRVQQATQQYDSVNATGTSFVYLTTFYYYNPSNGQIADQVVVRTVVDFRAYGSETFGVVTSYCTTGVANQCPAWL